ncbi:creatininase [Devosia pacifica]|uniref:Creatininase n=1 Tax=Devosia pacifica TaxID=1335967 RepID=A0A918S162_9HYPH|nr:creatininase family protein [Devosia pacifica]GHA17039.1 creatininase [Devosia pacifica]
MTTFFAEELTAPEFAEFVTAETIGVLPVAAIEPHGPHLPLSTDCDIARGHLMQIEEHVDHNVDVLVLPMQTTGHSLEHAGQPGLFTHSAETLLSVWFDIVAPFAAAGGRKLVVISSHDGNAEVVGLLTRRLRVSFEMIAVGASWLRFGQPDGVFAETELAYGLHGGDIETSLMLHYWPEAVRRDQLASFRSEAEQWDSESSHMTVHGQFRPGWLTADLNVSGALGDAAAASADKGALSAERALRGLAELIVDLDRFDIRRLAQTRMETDG